MSKEKILILIDWYLPGYKAGGPIKSVSTLVAKLKDEYSFHIITTDRDMGDEQSYNSVELDKWIRLDEDTAIYYCSGKSLGFFRFLKLMRAVNPKAIYLNSFFSKYFSVFPLIYKRMGLLHKKIVLAPRGMLGKGALEIKKGKKMFFIRFCKIMGLHKGIAWHSTSDQETDEIKAVFGNDVTIKFAPNISSDPNQTIIKRVKQKEELKIVFLSRISEKKNLLYSLEVVLKLNLMSRIEFDIYGPIEDEAYWKKCESMIKSMKGNKIVSYKGVLKGTEIQQTLSKYHFLFLPTKNENYGHVIIESLSAGTPVLISDQTPWKELAAKKIGCDLPLDDQKNFILALEVSALLNQAEFDELSKNAYAYAKTILNDPKIVEQNKMLFR